MKRLLLALAFLPLSAYADTDEVPQDVATQMKGMLDACWADDACEESEALSYCGDAIEAGGVPLEWLKCQKEVLRWWDDKLNEVYGLRMDIQKSYDADQGGSDYEARLRDMQRAWIPFRDAACMFASQGQPSGSGALNDDLQCLISQTQKQVAFIEDPLR